MNQMTWCTGALAAIAMFAGCLASESDIVGVSEEAVLICDTGQDTFPANRTDVFVLQAKQKARNAATNACLASGCQICNAPVDYPCHQYEGCGGPYTCYAASTCCIGADPLPDPGDEPIGGL